MLLWARGVSTVVAGVGPGLCAGEDVKATSVISTSLGIRYKLLPKFRWAKYCFSITNLTGNLPKDSLGCPQQKSVLEDEQIGHDFIVGFPVQGVVCPRLTSNLQSS